MTADLDEAKEHIDSALSNVAASLSADRLVLALSDYDDPWRKRIMPTIKANRTQEKPVLLHPLRDYLHTRYEVFQRPSLEGDDVLGILATHPTKLPGQKIVVTIDKDLRGVPGWLASLDDCDGTAVEPVLITEAEANQFHMLQALAGDPSDGYKGCPRIGMKTAAKLIPMGMADDGPFFPYEICWPIIVKTYEAAGLTEEDALLNARVARICRYSDYDFKTKKVKLWNPPA